MVRTCPKCVEFRTNIHETFHKESIPDRPWQKIAVDLFKNNDWYLIVTDYYSRFFEIFQLNRLTEYTIIMKLKELFSRYGIAEIVRSDNGPQFQTAFKNFAQEYNFTHITSSPYFPRSNGCVEAAVKVAKNLLKKNQDINLALLAYRSTPLENGFSPGELLMARKIRTHLPVLPSKLNTLVDTSSFREREEQAKGKLCSKFNVRHNSKELSELNVGDSVWVIDIRKYGKVIKKCNEPRSYMVQTDYGIFRRNRWHLIEAPYYFGEFNITPTWPTHSQVSSNDIVNELPTHSLITDSVDNRADHSDVQSETKIESEVESLPCHSDSISGENSTFNVRPNRRRCKPAYLSDYVCS